MKEKTILVFVSIPIQRLVLQLSVDLYPVVIGFDGSDEFVEAGIEIICLSGERSSSTL